MPNRIIKESINESRELTSCTFFAQDLYKRIITYADDYGRFNADPQIMIARLYPRELSVVSLDDLMDALVELTGAGKIAFYTAKARKEVYGAFPKWGDHQRVRDSKKKAPEPDDTKVNDWYLRRFIPLDMKVAIIERDKCKCKICGKHIAEVDDARRLAKLGTGLFHFDHIVPCSQGGRATMENLRLTCPRCNQTRRRMFSYDEVLEFSRTGGELPQDSANFCELPPNPIQSESESNPNPNPNQNRKGARAPFTPPAISEMESFFAQNGSTAEEGRACFDFYASKGWKVGKTPMVDWKASARGWIRRSKNGEFSGSGGKNTQTVQGTGDLLLRYTPEERKQTYSAAIFNLDGD